jgi:hypothetical protein
MHLTIESTIPVRSNHCRYLQQSRCLETALWPLDLRNSYLKSEGLLSGRLEGRTKTRPHPGEIVFNLAASSFRRCEVDDAAEHMRP